MKHRLIIYSRVDDNDEWKEIWGRSNCLIPVDKNENILGYENHDDSCLYVINAHKCDIPFNTIKNASAQETIVLVHGENQTNEKKKEISQNIFCFGYSSSRGNLWSLLKTFSKECSEEIFNKIWLLISREKAEFIYLEAKRIRYQIFTLITAAILLNGDDSNNLQDRIKKEAEAIDNDLTVLKLFQNISKLITIPQDIIRNIMVNLNSLILTIKTKNTDEVKKLIATRIDVISLFKLIDEQLANCQLYIKNQRTDG